MPEDPLSAIRQLYDDKKNGILYEWITIDLPKEEWYTCTACNGTKTYLTTRDLHRSAGWVPCYRCDENGLLRTRTEKRKIVRSKKSS